MRSLIRTAVLAALLVGCHDSTGPASDSLFTASATGALAGQLTGQSVAYADAAGQHPRVIAMNDATTEAAQTFLSMAFVNDAGAPMGRGTFPITQPFLRRSIDGGAFDASLYTAAIGTPNGVWLVATSGTVTIVAVSAARVRGRFDLQLFEVNGPLAATPRTIHLTGSFDAPVRVSVPCPTCVENERAGRGG